MLQAEYFAIFGCQGPVVHGSVRKVQGGPGALGAGARRGLRGERPRAPGGRRARLRLRGPPEAYYRRCKKESLKRGFFFDVFSQ